VEPQPGSLVRFSTDDLPRRDRIEAFREIYGRTILNVEVHPKRGEDFHSSLELSTLPDIGLGLGETSAMTYRRTSDLTQDDELLLIVLLNGSAVAAQNRRQTLIAAGEATLLWGADVGETVHPSGGKFFSIALSHKVLTPMLADLEPLLARAIPSDTEALQLLTGYARTLQQTGGALSPQSQRLASAHLYDLAATVLGATRDAQEIARHRGLRAARLRAIKDDIARNLADRTLGAGEVAKRQGISPRYIRSLFEGEETTFTDYLLRERLIHARRLLRSGRFDTLTIGAIALASGFTDISHFNHSFRRHFGVTPTDVRTGARRR
jgi:AraC-like DNA-binding protein